MRYFKQKSFQFIHTGPKFNVTQPEIDFVNVNHPLPMPGSLKEFFCQNGARNTKFTSLKKNSRAFTYLILNFPPFFTESFQFTHTGPMFKVTQTTTDFVNVNHPLPMPGSLKYLKKFSRQNGACNTKLTTL
jgi:hypothetical protein